jgi:orotidine-5'-phosphate decarboxylase
MSQPATRDRLIVALDVSRAAEARRIVAALGDSVSTFKIGKQLFTAEGPQVVRDLIAAGRRVFLDLKYHDIPNTVGAAVREAAALGVSMLTVHASGGEKMLRAAAEAAAQSAGKIETKPLVLAVTVLTSLDQADLEEVGVLSDMSIQVLRLAALAKRAGCGGIVTSARETRAVRDSMGDELAILVPGVRPAGSAAGDQARIATPAEAIQAGASFVVVGRPITAAADPVKAAGQILTEIDQAAHAVSR